MLRKFLGLTWVNVLFFHGSHYLRKLEWHYLFSWSSIHPTEFLFAGIHIGNVLCTTIFDFAVSTKQINKQKKSTFHAICFSIIKRFSNCFRFFFARKLVKFLFFAFYCHLLCYIRVIFCFWSFLETSDLRTSEKEMRVLKPAEKK